jgi:anti-sigma-K factor RskA
VTGEEQSTHDRYREDLAPYALGALPDREAAEVRDHLDRCDACRRHLRWLQPAVDLLPRTVTQLEPPPRLRRRLMSAVRGEARRTRASPEPRRRRWAALAWRPATAAAAGAFLVAGAAGGYLLHEADGANAPGSVTTVRATPGSELAATLERSDGTAILRMSHVPRLSGGRVYEAWVQRGGTVQPSSVFLPGPGHSAAAAVPGAEGADAVMVTAEPRGGSRQPTSRPIARITLN